MQMTKRNFQADAKMFGLITGNFEDDVTSKKLSNDDLFIMQKYLEAVMWGKNDQKWKYGYAYVGHRQ